MTRLRGVTWDHPRGYKPLEASAAYPRMAGIDLTWDRRSLKDFGDRSIAELAREFDLLVIDHPHVGVAAAADVLVPLDLHLTRSTLEQLGRESPGESHASYFCDGHQWALAIDAACQVAACRLDLLAGVRNFERDRTSLWPATWDAAVALAQSLRAHDLWLGVALCPTDCACTFLTLMAQSGAPLQTQQNVLPLPHVERTLQRLQQIAAVAHPFSRSWNPIQLYDEMSTGHEIAYSPLAFGYSNYADARFRGNAISFGPIPGRSGSLLGGAGIAVSRFTSERDNAIACAAYFASAECQAGTYFAAGGQPAHGMAWRRPAPSARSSFFTGTLDTMRQAHTRPRHATWPAFQPELGEIVHDFIFSERDIQGAARTISDRYRQCNPAT